MIALVTDGLAADTWTPTAERRPRHGQLSLLEERGGQVGVPVSCEPGALWPGLHRALSITLGFFDAGHRI